MKIYFLGLKSEKVMIFDKIELKSIINSNICFENCIYDEESGLVFSKTCNVMSRDEFFKKIIKNDLDPENGVGETIETVELKQENIIDLVEWSHKIICQKIFKKQYENGEIKV